jgi:hypothetical protein
MKDGQARLMPDRVRALKTAFLLDETLVEAAPA